MASIDDDAGVIIEQIEERSVAFIREQAAKIPEGYAGECYSCGLESKRLVNDMCAPCRDMRF